MTGKKIQLLELFGGIGAPRCALRNIGVPTKSIDYVEIDESAVRSYNAMFRDELSYKTQNIVGWTLKPDILVHGSPCFTGDTLVLTKEGYKPISKIEKGDYVLDHNNCYSLVQNTLNQGEKEIWEINAMAFDELRTTSNHRFYARKMRRVFNSKRRVYERVFEEPKWVECKDLSKEFYLGVAINKESKLPEWNGVECTRGKTTYIKKELDMNSDILWYVCGRYLGDGWIRNRKDRNNNLSGIIICCGKHKHEAFEEELGGAFNYTRIEERTTFKYQFPNKELAFFLSQFGKGAKNKRLPGFVFDLPVDKLKHLLKGYFDSDGSYVDGKYKATSVSRELIYGIAQCTAKAMKTHFAIYKVKSPRKQTIEGRVVNQNDSYNLVFKENPGKFDHAFYEDGYIWFPINSVRNTGGYEETFDITVKDSHSFTANSCIVHNCQDFSIAGHQKGAAEGSETRSSLMWETLRIIRSMGDWKPKYVIWENVKNVTSKHMKANFDRYVMEMYKLGYSSSWKTLDARSFGLPQARERVFTVSVLDSKAFDFDSLETSQMDDISAYIQKNADPVYEVTQPSILSVIGEKGIKRATVIKDYSYTITTRQDRSPAQVIDMKNGRYRYLTEQECWRLMGFSDEDYKAAASVQKRRGRFQMALYKQAGNSMPVRVLESIFKQIV